LYRGYLDEFEGKDIAVFAVAHPVIGSWGNNNSGMTKASCREATTRTMQGQYTPDSTADRWMIFTSIQLGILPAIELHVKAVGEYRFNKG